MVNGGLEELLKKFKSKSLIEIPLSELERAGFTRVNIGNEESSGFRVVSIAQCEMEREQAEANNKSYLFDTLDFQVKSDKLSAIKLSDDKFDKARRILYRLNNILYEKKEPHFDDYTIWDLVTPDNSIFTFREKFEAYLSEDPDISIERKVLPSLLGLSNAWLSASQLGLDFDFAQIKLIIVRGYERDYLSIGELSREIEKAKSKITDWNFLESDYLEEFCKSPGDKIKSHVDGLVIDLDDYDIGEKTRKMFLNPDTPTEQAIIYHISRFLGHYEFSEVADKVGSCREISEMVSCLRTLRSDSMPSYANVKHLQDKIKSAPKEVKIGGLSEELKKAKEKLKQERKIIDGTIQTFTPYRIISDFLVRELNELEKTLCPTGKESDAIWYLDGRRNPELDRNPGSVSGDCTDNRPLPFYRKDTHNIKVYDKSSNQHIGNIYLLETYNIGNKQEKVWHLETIQVPVRTNWNFIIESLVEALGKQAGKSGISYITVNRDNCLTSNYDYIAHAVGRYHSRQQKGNSINIYIPRVLDSESHSAFQGDGNTRVLWKNS